MVFSDVQELKVPVQEQLTTYPVNFENGCVQLSEIHFAELQRTIHSLKAQLEQREIACLLAKQVYKNHLPETIFYIVDVNFSNSSKYFQDNNNC